MAYQQFFRLVMIGILYGTLALANGCTTPSSEYCDKDTPCPEGQQCNTVKFRCEASTNDPKNVAPPIDDAALCQTDADCPTSSCTGGVLKSFTCAEGKCQSTESSCGAFICDAAGKTCLDKCAAQTDCQNGFCDAFNLDENKRSKCLPFEEICYVDVNNCQKPMGAGTRENPYCQIQFCLDAGKPITAVSDGEYHENLIIKADAQIVALNKFGSLYSEAVNQLKVKIIPQKPRTDGVFIAADQTKKYRVVLAGLDIFHREISSADNAASGQLVSVRGPATVGIYSCHIHQANGRDFDLGNCISSKNGPSITVEDSILDGGETGGWYHVGEGTATLRRVKIFNNDGFGFSSMGTSMVSARDLQIYKNASGLAVNGGQVDLDRLRVFANTGTWGEYWVPGINLTNVNHSIVSNALVYGHLCGGMLLQGTTGPFALTLTNATFANNDGQCPGNARSELQFKNSGAASSNISIINSIFWTERGSGAAMMDCPNCQIAFSIVKGGVPENSFVIFEADPQFNNADMQNPYQLTAGSPGIDAGLDFVPGVNPMPEKDLLGRKRYVDKLHHPNVIDIGAYELP